MDYSNPAINEKRTRKYYKSKAKKTKNKLIVMIIRIVIIILIVVAAGLVSALCGAYINIIDNAPKLEQIFTTMDTDDNYTTIIVDPNTGEEIDRLGSAENREYVSSADIPLLLKLAFVAIEDERFYEHDGVDFKGIVRMFYVALTSTHSEGASTITQQVIKNKLGYMRNVIETKLQEQVLAVNFEKVLTEELGSKERAKDYILTVYLNSAFLGHNQYGVQAASLFFFNKHVSDLTLSECAALAAITSNPTKRSPLRRPESNNERREAVLKKMLELGFINREEYDEAWQDDVYTRIQETSQLASLQPSYHSYFIDQVITDVIRDLREQYNLTLSEATNWIYYRGLTIYPTMDQRIQSIVDAAYMNEALFPKTEYEVVVEYNVSIKNTATGLVRSYSNSKNKGVVKSMVDADAYVESLKDKILKEGDVIVAGSERIYRVPQPQSAFIVIDYHTGYVVAMAGGRGEKLTNRSLNRATGAERQPGSTFKVVASYAAAFDLGLITAATVIDDIPHFRELPSGELDEWPRNWNSKFLGLNSVRTAITQSMNVLAVKNLENIGVSNAFKYLNNFGFTTLVEDTTKARNDWNLSLALGGITNGVTQVELAAAYGTIANQGIYNKPVFYTKVLDHNGNILLENKPEPQQVLKKTTAFILTDILRETMITGTGQRASFSKAVTIPTAGKTGTTSDTKDLVFAGFTPYYAATVWLGYDQPKKLNKNTTDDRIHLKLWSGIMEEIHKVLPYKDFSVPDGIIRATICSQSGLLPVSGLCNRDPRELERKGSIIHSEYFEVGTEPSEYCSTHMEYRICVAEKKIPGSYCPSDHIATIIGIVRPEPYYGGKSIGDRYFEVPAAVLNQQYCTVHTAYWQSPPAVQETQSQDTQPAEQESDGDWQNIFLPMPTATPANVIVVP